MKQRCDAPTLSSPGGGEGDKVGAAYVPPPPCRAVRPGRRDCAARRMARSQANGVGARRLREMNKLGEGQGEVGETGAG